MYNQNALSISLTAVNENIKLIVASLNFHNDFENQIVPFARREPIFHRECSSTHNQEQIFAMYAFLFNR